MLPAELEDWIEDAGRLVERWFALEDPTRLEPAERELYVGTTSAGCSCAATSTGSTWPPTA